MKNAVFYKCCIVNVHVSTTPEKHSQKPSKIHEKSFKIDLRTHPERSCEAKRAEEERKSALDDAESAPERTPAGENGVSARCEFPRTGSGTIEEGPQEPPGHPKVM